MKNFIYCLLFCAVAAACPGCEDGEHAPCSDVEINADYAVANRYADKQVLLVLSDADVVFDGRYVGLGGEGRAVALDIYVQLDESGLIPAGDYKFVDKWMYGSKPSSFYGAYFSTDAEGRVRESIDMTGATLAVSRSKTAYSFDLKAHLPDGRSLHCTYTGAVRSE